MRPQAPNAAATAVQKLELFFQSLDRSEREVLVGLLSVAKSGARCYESALGLAELTARNAPTLVEAMQLHNTKGPNERVFVDPFELPGRP